MSSNRPIITLRQVLAFVAIVLIVFVSALIIIPSSMFPLKSYLDEQGLLSSTITFLGVVIGGFIAGLILTVVNERIQTYSWKRDQALKDIDTIYEPLYKDVSEVVKATETLDVCSHQSFNWDSIKDSYLGTKLELMKRELYGRLQDLFGSLYEYHTKRWDAMEMLYAIARKVIEKRLDESIAQGNLALKELVPKPPSMPKEHSRIYKDEILDGTIRKLDYAETIYSGFLKGKSVREWSALHTGDADRYIEVAWSDVKHMDYSEYVTFGVEEIEAMLDEIYHKVQADSKIMKQASWCEAFNQKAMELKKKLEDQILKPQLP